MSVSNPSNSDGENSNSTDQLSTIPSYSSQAATPNYYFDNYYRKKLAIYENILKSNERRKILFACKIFFEAPVKAGEVYNSLEESVGESLTKRMIGLSPAGSLKTWIFNFENINDFNLAVNKEIKMNDKTFVIKDSNENILIKDKSVTLKAVFRFHRLALDAQAYAVVTFLKDQKIAIGDIEVEKEKYKEDKLKHIHTGVINAKFSFDIKNYSKVINLIGSNTIDNQRCIIQLSGHEPRCLICHKFGHLSKNCPANSIICPTCNKRGHTVCSIANRISNIQATSTDEQELEENEAMEFVQPDPNVNNDEQSSVPLLHNVDLNKVLENSILQTNQQENYE
jgi:hypothetical protein